MLLARKLGAARQAVVAEFRHDPWLWLACAVLLLVGANWMRLGFKCLIVLNAPGPSDLHFRWTEQRYLYNGQNPNDIILRAAALFYKRPLPECARNDRIDPKIGPLHYGQGGYPPWAYLTMAAFVLPTSYQSARNYFALINAVALGVTLVWGYRIGRPYGRAGGVFLAASVMAIYANVVCLDRGQNSILIDALLIGVYVLLERGRPVLAGLAYGLSAIKPQMVALFAVIFMVKRQWRLLLAATAYVVLASIAIWALAKTGPIEMLQQMYTIALSWIDHGNSSVLHLLVKMGMDQQIATPLVAALGLASTMALVWLWRNAPTLTLFAVAAVIGRLWSYHGNYDDVMLLFLVVALGKIVLSRRSIGPVLAFVAVGLSLWIRLRLHPKDYPMPYQVFQMGSWLAGMVVVLASKPRRDRPETASSVEESDVELRQLAVLSS
jgi:hypothetical protein